MSEHNKPASSGGSRGFGGPDMSTVGKLKAIYRRFVDAVRRKRQ